MSNEIMSSDLPAISSDALISMAEQATKRIEAVKAIKQTSMKVTNENDWVDQNGKPYLQASGGEKIARLFGISWTIEEPSIEYEESGHYTYTYKGVFSLSSASIEAIGTRSSKDPFFRKYKYVGNERIEQLVSEISKDDVKKSAYTNLIGNGITRLLGIRNLTYDDLRAAGLDVSKITKVEYKKHKPEVSAPKAKVETPPPEQHSEDVISEAQCKRFYAIAKGAGWDDTELKKWLLENYKIDSTKKISRTIYEHICEKVTEDAPAKKVEDGQ